MEHVDTPFWAACIDRNAEGGRTFSYSSALFKSQWSLYVPQV